MADGSSGNLGGVLFEAGKTISDAGKGAANAAASQVTGNPTPLFSPNGQKPQTTGVGGFLPQKPAGGMGGQMPKADPFGDFGKMFEGGKPGFGAKKPQSPVPQSQQFSQEELDTMAAQNKASDDQEILKRQAELEQIKQSKQAKHKQLHDEIYFDKLKNVGQNSMAQDRQNRQQANQQTEAENQQNPQQNPLGELGSNMMGKNPQLGTPVSVQQAKTVTEINRGTTG